MSARIDSVSPNTGRAFADWAPMDAEATDRLVRDLAGGAASLATDHAARRRALDAAIAAMRNVAEELAATTVREVGKTPAEAAGEVDYAIAFLETAKRLLATHPFVTEAAPGRLVREVPLGLGLLIAPYNDPIAGLTRKIGPCLAAGAGAIVKPSALGVQTALVLERAFAAEGLGEAVRFLPVADHAILAATIARDEIGVVSFTGSTETGLALAAQCAAALTPFVGELGGANPFVIFADADLEAAVDDLLIRKIKAAGQACSAQNMVFVEAAAAAEIRERIQAAAASVRFGPSDEPGVAMGPVRTRAATARLAELGRMLEQGGARRLAGGVEPATEGAPFLAAPTVYEIDGASLLDTQEAFGPLFGLSVFDDRAALQTRLARATQPLALYVYGADIDAMGAFVAPLRFGSIGFNTTAIQSPDVPTGGFRRAGIGREGGRWGLAEFLTTINLRLPEG